MKRYIVVLMMLLISSVCFAKEMEKMPLIVDYNNIEVSGETIIVYGGDGMIQYSFDDGYNWKRKQIYPSEILTRILIKNDDIYAFSISGKVALSKDKGETWNTIYKFKDPIYSLKEAGENYMVRSNSKIIICDSNFNYLYEKPILSRNTFISTFEGKSTLSRPFANSEVYMNKDYYFSLDSSRILWIKSDFSQSDTIDLFKSSVTSLNNYFFRLFTDGSKAYFGVYTNDVIGRDKILSTSDFMKFDTLYQTDGDVFIFNLHYFNNKLIFLKRDSSKSCYETTYLDIFSIYSKDSLRIDNSIVFPNSDMYFSFICFLDTNKIVLYRSRNFILVQHFNKNEPTYYSYLSGDGISISPDIYNDSTLIFYKGDNSGSFRIKNSKTSDYGLTFTPFLLNRESQLNNNVFGKYFDQETKSYYFYRNIGNEFGLFSIFSKEQITNFISINSKLVDIVMPNFPSIAKCKDTNYSKLILPAVINIEPPGQGTAVRYIMFDDSLNTSELGVDNFKVPDYIYFKDSATFVMHYYDQIENKRYISYSNDRLNNWNIIKEFEDGYEPKHTKEITFKGKDYLFLFYYNDNDKKNTVYMLDLDNYQINQIAKCSNNLYDFDLSPTAVDSDGEYIYLAIKDTLFTITDPYNRDTWTYNLFPNNGRIRQTLKKFNDKFIGYYAEGYDFLLLPINQYWFSFYDDTLTYPQYTSEDYDFGVRFINLPEGIKKKLRLTNVSQTEDLIIYGVSQMRNFSHNIPNDIWRQGLKIATGEYYEFEVEFFPKNIGKYVEYLVFYTNAKGEEILFKISGEAQTDVSVNEINLRDYIYTMEPYPIPARNILNTRIYWEKGNPINLDNISIYDLNGNKLETKNKLTIDYHNSYKGLLQWDCSAVENGIYIIHINYGNNRASFKVLVNK